MCDKILKKTEPRKHIARIEKRIKMSKTVNPETKKHFDYKWVIVVTSFLMVMISLGFGSSTKTLFPDLIADELGVPRSVVSIYESVRYISTAIVNIFFGVLIARFGPKKLIGAGYVSLITAILLLGFAKNIWSKSQKQRNFEKFIVFSRKNEKKPSNFSITTPD